MTPKFPEVRLGRSVQLITQKASESDFKVALEDIESWTGKLSKTESSVYEGEGIAFLPGDVLFGKLRPYLAKALTVESPGAAVGDFWVLRPVKYTPAFLTYLLLNKSFIDLVNGASYGSKMPRVSWDFGRNVLLPRPDMKSQIDVVSYLDRETAQIDVLIEKQQLLIETIAERRQALITNCVKGGALTPRRDSGIPWMGSIPKDWSINKLKRNSYIKARVGWKGLTSDEFETSSFAYLVTGQDFTSRSVDFKMCYQIDQTRYEDDPYIQLREGDLLVTKDGSIGKVAVVGHMDKPACLNSGIFVVRPTSEYISDFLYWVLCSDVFKEFIKLTSSGSTILHLYQNVFQEFSFAFPDLESQRRIVEILEVETSRLDQLVEKAKSMVSVLQERRNALISAAITGKIDVRGA